MDDNSLTIDDLELSVRTSTLLGELSVKTLDEILALPRITATPLSIAELREVFDELNVSYQGEFISANKSNAERITGSLLQRWATIKEWLLDNCPSAYEEFLAPATEAQILQAEEALEARLPADYRQFLLLHNGQAEFADGAMAMTCALVPVGEIQELRQSYSEVFDQDDVPVLAEDVDPAIRAVEYSPGWIPIGCSARGRDYLCLDLDPSDKGTCGQVILTAVDSDTHQLLASSFSDFLSLYFEKLQSGEIEI